MEKVIHIKGAKVHNLKGIDVSIPREQMVVITGVSGSGKSSLAFDTLFAEGYRKFMDSLSTRARQIMEQIERPEVDYIEGLTPVIAIEQRTGTGANPRSTVASITEIADFARLLWSLCGEAYCPEDGGRIVQQSLDDCLGRIFTEPEGSRVMVVAPYMEAKVSVLRNEVPHLKQKGYLRVRLDGKILELEDPDLFSGLKGEQQMDLIIDRLILRPDQRSRLADSLELAFREADNRAFVLLQDKGSESWRSIPVSQHFACEKCGTVFPEITPRHFSWDHPDGACRTCGGLGETLQFTPELLVPDPEKSVRKGALKPWRIGSRKMIIARNAQLKQLAEQLPFDPTVPWKDLSEDVRKAILYGTGEREFLFKLKPGNRKPQPARFEGVLADLERSRRDTSSDGFRHRLMAYQIRNRCEDCGGARLKKSSRSVLLAGTPYTEFLGGTLGEAQAFVEGLKLPGFEEAIKGLHNRLQFLNEVGLSYLSLDRSYASLSGGEAQRVRLATQVGMGLVGVTYVLDEPTIGLHPANTADLLRTLTDLRDRGNSVIVVEHDPDVIRASDHLLEIGPGAGEAGGELVFQGTVKEATKDKHSQTGAFLSGRARVERSVPIKEPTEGWVRVKGAHEHNLKEIDVAFPMGLLTVVTGVSGSGKSTLVNDVLGKAAAFKLNRAKEIPGRHRGIDGLSSFERVVRVDQSPIGRSPRSNPATFTKIFDDLRKLFAQTPLAKVRGYGPGRFSFNVRGGRCERCQGDGAIKLDMQFLSDVYTECPSCHGHRYNRETLEVRFKGYNIADVLDLTVDSAVDLFAHQPKLRAKLETLQAVGLGYIRLGQAAPTLSGGEAQRLKLSLELSKSQRSHNLYILDEPTTGLHWVDIQHLMDLLFKLREQGQTLIMIEHNIDVIRLADWIIDLGPGGGTQGGEVLHAGPFEELKSIKRSATAKSLKGMA
ncbi:excinuclease ABC subunit UvrA [Puniceicoccales bacterium CK1056]|uniref:UvrABC system protein A n=2 Tax=Oceanipulchritudo coccoides TaxID=2706888 RepID=A0A6B2M565_9BACT|nr:excinuclease ABC subunit UvrA [Oceanipulchritudo coccoides]